MANKARVGLCLVVAGALSGACGFALHVFSVESVTRYVAAAMAGRQVIPSWDVRIPAALSSIEGGIALALLYLLLRAAFPAMPTWRRGFLLAILTLALSGNLVRQPLMDLLVGNPLTVVAVQDGMVWFMRLAMGLITAVCMDLLIPDRRQAATSQAVEA